MSYCQNGCGADLDETDGNTVEIEPGVVVELCPECTDEVMQ